MNSLASDFKIHAEALLAQIELRRLLDRDVLGLDLHERARWAREVAQAARNLARWEREVQS